MVIRKISKVHKIKMIEIICTFFLVYYFTVNIFNCYHNVLNEQWEQFINKND